MSIESKQHHLVSFSLNRAGAMPYLYLAASKLHVAEEVSSLCIPMGVTFNANGSAIFIACAILFLAQLQALSMGASQVFTALYMNTVLLQFM